VAGLLDDLFSLGPIPKLAAQIAAALLVIFNGLTISGLISNDFLAGVVALVWLVGMTNAFNLLDNMDGLAATLARSPPSSSPSTRSRYTRATPSWPCRSRSPRLRWFPPVQSALRQVGGGLHGRLRQPGARLSCWQRSD
jgi:UDP-N-acetylmuramyl pentapeptide phosphotransferase/UDP-N-acetylglucosamine-1-phosphate transferase